MTATLTFTLPREEAEHHAALHGMAYRAALTDIREALRSKMKHGHDFKTANEALEYVRQVVQDALEDAELTQGLP